MALLAGDGDLLGADHRVPRAGREVPHGVEREAVGLEREGAVPLCELGGRGVHPVGRGGAQVARHAGEDVLRAEELRHIGRCRAPEDLGRRARLQHTPAVEQDGEVTEHPGLGEVVRHLQGGEPPLAVQRAHLATDEGTAARIERAERFVEEEEPGSPCERARERDELPFAPREAPDVAAEERRDPHPLRGLVQGGRVCGAVGDVLPHREVGEEERVLVDESHAAGLGRRSARIGAVELHAPRGGREESGDHLEQGRLPGARGADDDAVRRGLEREAHRVEREAPLPRGDAVEADHRSGRRSVRSARRSVSGTSARIASAAATGSASVSPKLVKRS